MATETQNSLAVFTLWSMVLLFSLVTSRIIATLGIVGTFGFFAGISLAGAFYFIWCMKTTDGLSSSECKQVYWPVDLKQ